MKKEFGENFSMGSATFLDTEKKRIQYKIFYRPPKWFLADLLRLIELKGLGFPGFGASVFQTRVLGECAGVVSSEESDVSWRENRLLFWLRHPTLTLAD
jgi:hypothetical protein